MNQYPYCNSQKIIFEEGSASPKPKSKTMLTVAPHGILTLGFTFMVTSDEFESSDVKWLVTDMLLKLPFIRDMMVWSDAWEVSKDSMNEFLQQEENVALIPGGFQEATIYLRDRHRLFIKDRKGFIKYALKYGYSILPAYVFGEERGFWQFDIGSIDFRFWLNKYNIPTIAFIGKYGFLPDNNIDVTIVIGKSYALPKIDHPTDEDINKHHADYIKCMEGLFDRNKERYAFKGKDAVLELF